MKARGTRLESEKEIYLRPMTWRLLSQQDQHIAMHMVIASIAGNERANAHRW